MNFDSGIRYNLIGNKIKRNIYKIIQNPTPTETISDKITGSIVKFYDNYIKQNKFLTLCVLIILIFLIYRYYNRTGEKPKKIENTENYKIFDALLEKLNNNNNIPAKEEVEQKPVLEHYTVLEPYIELPYV